MKNGKMMLRYMWVCVAFLTVMMGCISQYGAITKYDPVTYRSLTDLKPQVLMLYDTFCDSNFDTGAVTAVRLKIAQAYEYELGKGSENRETAEQLKKLQEMFDRHVAQRSNGGPWSATHRDNQKEIIGAAFDIAIETEMMKNRTE